jgi:hypothetical protein
VARRDPLALCDLIEEPFEQVTGAVEIWDEADRLVAMASRAQVHRLAAKALIQSP